MNDVKSTLRNAAVDLTIAEALGDQLASRDDAVLRRRELRDPPLAISSGVFSTVTVAKLPLGGHAPRLPTRALLMVR